MKSINISQSKLRLVYLFEKALSIHSPDYYADSALLHLLKKHLVNLPNPDDYFHKAFRQVDVIEGDRGTTDIVIHNLLSQSKEFWRIFPKCQNNRAIVNERDFEEYCTRLMEDITRDKLSDEDKLIDARTTFHRGMSELRGKEDMRKIWDELPIPFRHEISKQVTKAIVERHPPSKYSAIR